MMEKHLMRYSHIIFLTGIALITSSTAFAEPKEFGPADANGDGIVDKAEFAAQKFEGTTFEEADLNKDGKISKDEYEEARSSCD